MCLYKVQQYNVVKNKVRLIILGKLNSSISSKAVELYVLFLFNYFPTALTYLNDNFILIVLVL